MRFFKQSMKRSTLLLAVLASATLLAGCDNDPAPSKSSQRNYEETKMAATAIKQPLEIEGCIVKVHRVTTANSDILPNFTIAVAKCPTATVTSTQHGCGKNCSANNIVVQPRAIEALELAAPRDKAQQRKELREEINRLATRLDALERDL